MKQCPEFLKNLVYRRYDVYISPTDDVAFEAWSGAIVRNNMLYTAEQIRIQKSGLSLREQIDTLPLEDDHPLYREMKEGFPKGYVLTNFSFTDTSNPCMVLRKGDTYSFSLLLIGCFNDYRFYFFEAIRQMCERGMGKPLTPFSLIDIRENPSSPVILNDFTSPPPSPTTQSDATQTEADDITSDITIRFLTPVILYRLRDKQNTQLSYQDKTNRFPSFYQLVRSSFSRLYKLYALYENPSGKNTSFFDESYMETYLEKAGRPLLKSANIQHITLQNTQKKGKKNELPLAGYIGEQTYSGNMKQYVPLLKFMADLGVGNETVYGMGRFEIVEQYNPNRIDKNQKVEVENEGRTIDNFLGEGTEIYDNNLPKMLNLNQIIIRFKNQISQRGIPLFAEATARRVINNNDPFHTHNVSNKHYCYPMIQCKRINGRAAIICIGEGTERIGGYFASANEPFLVDGKEVTKEVETVKAENNIVQAWDSEFVFSIRKYLPLSNEFYTEYQNINETIQRRELIAKILKANILLFAQSIGIHFDREVICQVTDWEEKAMVKYKNHTFASFDLIFKTNISLPNYIGLGIGVSHGYGTVVKKSGP